MISVLIPVYNVGQYLRECLDSAVSQTYEDIEIICIDDGSTDNSPEILLEYADQDKRIKLISQVNSGYGKAMNAGLELATGEYIAILESDDFINREMLEYLYRQATAHDVDFIKTDFFRYKRGEDSYTPLYEKPLYDEVFEPKEKDPGFLFAGGNIWTGLYRRDFLRENGIRFNETPGASYQDIAFTFKVFACAKRILIKNRAFYHYRIDNASASVKSKSKVFCVCDEIDETERFLNERPDLFAIKDSWLSAYRFFCYHWNYDRISAEYKTDFLVRWHEDMKTDWGNGRLDSDYFPKNMLDEVNEMMDNWENYYCTKIADIRSLQWIRDGFKAEASRHHVCYMYGAGRVAKRVYDLLEEYGIELNAVLVNDPKDNPEKFFGKDVRAYSDNDLERVESNVYVALGSDNMFDAVDDLYSTGYRNVIPMTSRLINQLIQG